MTGGKVRVRSVSGWVAEAGQGSRSGSYRSVSGWVAEA